jgi:hypothetical protein
MLPLTLHLMAGPQTTSLKKMGIVNHKPTLVKQTYKLSIPYSYLTSSTTPAIFLNNFNPTMATGTDPELEQLLQDFPYQEELDGFDLDLFTDMSDPFAFIDFNAFPSSPLKDLSKTNTFTPAPVKEPSDSPPSEYSPEFSAGPSDEKGSPQTTNHQLDKLEDM